VPVPVPLPLPERQGRTSSFVQAPRTDEAIDCPSVEAFQGLLEAP
jgi:hypothetical protein